jgi:hypothetical protein
MFIHVSIYGYMYMYLYVNVHIYMHKYIGLFRGWVPLMLEAPSHICVYLSTYIYIYIYKFLSIYVCTCICIQIFIFVYLYIYRSFPRLGSFNVGSPFSRPLFLSHRYEHILFVHISMYIHLLFLYLSIICSYISVYIKINMNFYILIIFFITSQNHLENSFKRF